eukprot:1580782-Amphidinium_carterae.6
MPQPGFVLLDMREVLHTSNLEASDREFNSKIVKPAQKFVRVSLDHVTASFVPIGFFHCASAQVLRSFPGSNS